MICQWQADQIIDLRDTDKSTYFAITKFYKFCHLITKFVFLINIFGKQSYLPFFTQERLKEGLKRDFVYA